VYFAHSPQYTSLKSAASKKRKAETTVSAHNTSEAKKTPKLTIAKPLQPPSPAPQYPSSVVVLKQENNIEEPPHLVESPTSSSAESPSSCDDAAWLDDVGLENGGDPGAMLEQLMKDEPASPLEGAVGIFGGMWG
jgi:hypothetical protein